MSGRFYVTGGGAADGWLARWSRWPGWARKATLAAVMVGAAAVAGLVLLLGLVAALVAGALAAIAGLVRTGLRGLGVGERGGMVVQRGRDGDDGVWIEVKTKP